MNPIAIFQIITYIVSFLALMSLALGIVLIGIAPQSAANETEKSRMQNNGLYYCAISFVLFLVVFVLNTIQG